MLKLCTAHQGGPPTRRRSPRTSCATGSAASPAACRLRRRRTAWLSELLDDVLARVAGERPEIVRDRHLLDRGHVHPYSGNVKATSITAADIRADIAERQAAEAANATMPRQLAALTRAYSLRIEAGRVTHKPLIKSLSRTTPCLQGHNIVSPGNLTEAACKLDAFAGTIAPETTAGAR